MSEAIEMRVPTAQNDANRVIVPSGQYPATITGVSIGQWRFPKANQETGETYADQRCLKWLFAVKGKSQVIELEAETSLSFDPKSKAYRYHVSAMGEPPTANKLVPSDYVGKQVMLSLEKKTSKKGTNYMAVKDVLPEVQGLDF